jgi:hypothetical protein
LEKAKADVEEDPEPDAINFDEIKTVYERYIKEEEIKEDEKATCIQSLKRLLDIFEPEVEPMQDEGEEEEEISEPMQGEEVRDAVIKTQNKKFKKYGMEIFSYEDNN